MFDISILLGIVLLAISGYWAGTYKANIVAQGDVRQLHSRQPYYGYMVALWISLPAVIIMLLWLTFEADIVTHLLVSKLPNELLNKDHSLLINEIKNLASTNLNESIQSPALINAARHYQELTWTSYASFLATFFFIAIVGGLAALKKITPTLRARNQVEDIIRYLLILCSIIAIFTTVGIIFSVLFEAIRFFEKIPFFDFVFGLEWSPQMAIREDQVGSSGAFGMIPVFAGTMMITIIAMMIAVPIGLYSAIYLSEYAPKKFRSIAKPLLEVLAGVPTVVYGFFAALVVAPMIRDSGSLIGLSVSSESALAAGLVMGIMIIPFVSSLSDDVINAVPQSLRDGAYALGSTQAETVRKVVLPAALPGIVGGVLLAVSRAIGETMIVVMAAGLSANLTANPLEAVTTVTVQIVTLLVGDQEFDSAKTLAAFALALMLFVVTLFLNVIALHIVRKYREQYE